MFCYIPENESEQDILGWNKSLRKRKNPTLKKFSLNRIWITGAVQTYVDPTLITWIRTNNYKKPEKDSVKIKSNRDPTLEKLDMYEFKMTFFDNSKPEDFLLFVQNINMKLNASVTITSNKKLQYLHTILCVEVMLHFDTFCDKVVRTTMEHLNQLTLGLCTYFFLWIHFLGKSAQCAAE